MIVIGLADGKGVLMRPMEVMMVTRDTENTDRAMWKDSDGKGNRKI